MAKYTFKDCLTGIVYSKEMQAARALFILARHDIETRLLFEPISIEHNGVTYTKEDILLCTAYRADAVVKVLLAESEAVPTLLDARPTKK